MRALTSRDFPAGTPLHHFFAWNEGRLWPDGRYRLARDPGAAPVSLRGLLAAAVGNSKKPWRAYLSTTAPGGDAGVNARDRIGKGPWQNVEGVVIAKDVDDLHSPNTNINKKTALTEKGEIVPGRVDPVNTHDVLTGSDPQGMYSTAGGDTTCDNWTKGGDDGSAIVGHHDRMGLKVSRHMMSWNSSHGTRGCSPEGLKSTGGAGLFYCFLAN